MNEDSQCDLDPNYTTTLTPSTSILASKGSAVTLNAEPAERQKELSMVGHVRIGKEDAFQMAQSSGSEHSLGGEMRKSRIAVTGGMKLPAWTTIQADV